MKKLVLRSFIIASILMTIGAMFAAVQIVNIAPASAAADPPPAACGTSTNYTYGDPQCWGNAGNPPDGCLNADGTVNTDQNCLDWKANVPSARATGTGTACQPGQVLGPLNACCAPTDKACLAGTVTTPQGDPASLALAAQICQALTSLKNLDKSQIPFACTLPTPTIEAGTAACQLAAGGNLFDSGTEIVLVECGQLEIKVAGEVPPTNAPGPTDAATAATICGIVESEEKKGNIPVAQVPANCASGKTPLPQDGVLACKALLQDPEVNGLAAKLFAKPCLDLITRNPANSAGTPLNQTPQHVNFDDTDLKKFTEGLSAFGIFLCIGGIMVSVTLWALGSKGNNEGQQHSGKRGLIVCCLAAFIIGALPQLFIFYDGIAHTADDNQVTAAN